MSSSLTFQTTKSRATRRQAGRIMPDECPSFSIRSTFVLCIRTISRLCTTWAPHPLPTSRSTSIGPVFPSALAVLCERWAAFMLISAAALMPVSALDSLVQMRCAVRESQAQPTATSALCWVDICWIITFEPRRGLGISSLILLLLLHPPCLFPIDPHCTFPRASLCQPFPLPSTQRILAALYPSGDSQD